MDGDGWRGRSRGLEMLSVLGRRIVGRGGRASGDACATGGVPVIDQSAPRWAGMLRKNWNLRSYCAGAPLARVPTMLTPEECRMLAWIAQVFPSGAGVICDLGSFLGGSTVHLAAGANLSPHRPVVHAFDQFTSADEHKQHWLYDHGYPPFEGNDMLHAFQEFTEPYRDLVRPWQGMIEAHRWTGEPIEVLFVDICKGWDTTDHVLREFYPALIPGGSVVIHQDFQHWMHPWVVATTEALHPKLSLVSWTEENSAVFACTAPITREDVAGVALQEMPAERVLALIERASERFPFARQREAVWENRIAYAKNPAARFSWELTL